MSAIVLCGKSVNIDRKDVRSLYKGHGLGEPEKLLLGEHGLMAWPGVISKGPLPLYLKGNMCLACAGTMIYRGSSGERGLRSVLDDLVRGALDTREFRGAFCLFVIGEARAEVITDAANLYSVFGDTESGSVSPSLQAVLNAGYRRRKINRKALCEQLVTGIITGEDTCFEGIQRLNGCGSIRVAGLDLVCRQADSGAPGGATIFRSAGECVEFQLGVLRDHFKILRSVAGERGVSMGLSGGYDSRLMLSLAVEAGIPIKPFTYSSPNHMKEKRIAAEVANQAGLIPRQVELKCVESLSDSDLDANIDDALSFYDGRTNATMGTFGDVHTRHNQVACVGDASLNLNGLGGELYRNRERLPPSRFPFRDWLKHYVIGPNNGCLFVSKSARSAFEGFITEKYGKLLGVERPRWFDRELARRYYRDIWLPYSAGPRISAENQVGMSLMPFAEAEVSAAALRATPFIGPHGEFEAAMIRRIDEGIAGVQSSYGHSFAHNSLKRQMRDIAVSQVPLWARLLRHRVLDRLRGQPHAPGDCWRVRFAEPVRLLRSLNLPLEIGNLLRDPVLRDRTLYIAEFLHRHREHIDVTV